MKTEREIRLEGALRALVEEHCDYMMINSLGDPEKQHNIKRAREALSDEGSGGGPDHSRDFEGSDPRGMGPLPGEPGNPNPSFEQMENDTPPQRRDAMEALEHLVLKAGKEDCRNEYSAVSRALSDHEALKQAYGAAVMELQRLGATSVPLYEPAVLGNCMYCDKPVALGEQAEQHFSHATCDQQERESVEALEGEKMRPCWGDFMQRIYQLGITDPSEIAKADEPAVPSVPSGPAVRSACNMLRSRFEEAKCDSNGVDCCIRCNVMFLVDELERALAQSGEGGINED